MIAFSNDLFLTHRPGIVFALPVLPDTAEDRAHSLSELSALAFVMSTLPAMLTSRLRKES